MADYTQILLARGTLSYWTTTNPILGLGEVSLVTDYVSDSQRIKIGDGINAWNSLSFFSAGGGGGVWGSITGTLSAQTDLQTALDARLKLDGTNSPSANISWNSFQITNLNAISGGSTTIDLLNGNWKWLSVESVNASERRLKNASGTSRLDWDLLTVTGAWTAINGWRFSSATSIADANGNELIEMPATVASAVNHFRVTNAISGGTPVWESIGDDTNVGMILTTKGTTSLSNIELRINNVNRLIIANASITAQVSLTCNATLTGTTAVSTSGRLQLQGTQAVTATNGGSTSIATNICRLIINVSGTIATHTFTLPASTINDGTVIKMMCGSGTITALTLNPGSGTTVVGAITTITAGGFAEYTYRSADAIWYRSA